MINEDPNAKLIRELKDEVDRLREILRLEGIDVGEGHSQFFFFLFRLSMLSFACLVVACFVVLKSSCFTLNITACTVYLQPASLLVVFLYSSFVRLHDVCVRT